MLLGELAFAPFDRLVVGYDIGPQALYVMSTVLALDLLFISLFYKELKLATFDASLAAALGFSPVLTHYGLIALVSLTAVGAFNAAGSILVVALMIGPPAAAYLLTDRLGVMLWLSALIDGVSALAGYWLARVLDASIAGSIATMIDLIFGAVLLFAPERGLLALARRQMRQRWEFAQTMLTIHLLNHEGEPEQVEESQVAHLNEHLRWEPRFAARVVGQAERRRLVQRQAQLLTLTERGRQIAQQRMAGS